MPKKKYTEQELIKFLNKLPKNVNMSKSKFNEYYKTGKLPVSYWILNYYLGTIEKICELGGLPYNLTKKKLNPDDLKNKLIIELKALPKDIEMTIIIFNEYYKTGKLSGCYITLTRYFGDIINICKVGGLLYSKSKKIIINISDENILNMIVYLDDNFRHYKISDIDKIFHKKHLICGTKTIRNKFESFYNVELLTGVKFIDTKGKYETYILNFLEKEKNWIIIRNHTIDRINGEIFKPDGYCKETNTIIEVYEFWHNYQNKYDNNKRKEIEDLGYKYLIIYDTEFFKTHKKPY